MSEPKTIGSLNGVWAVLIRIVLTLVPLSMPFWIWITAQTFENMEHRKSAVTQREMMDFKIDMTKRISELPPPEWRARIIALELNQSAILREVVQIRTMIESQKKP